MGVTTYEVIDCLDDCLFNKNFNAVIIAHEMKALESIFRKVQTAWKEFYSCVGGHIGFRADMSRTNMLSFNNGSVIKIALSSRGETVSRLHISEFGKICRQYPLKAEEIITGAFPSVPADGRIDIESTAEGEIGSFCDMFWEAWESKSNFKAHFFPWHIFDEYRTQAQIIVPPKLKEYQVQHDLDDEQIAWYYLQSRELKDKIKQEHPSTPEEAFESSGYKVFNVDILNKRLKRDIEDGERIGKWIFYEEYQPNHLYALGADPAEGVGRDSSAAHIIDFSYRLENGQLKPKIVGVFEDNKIQPDIFAYELKRGGSRYGECLIAVERNNTGLAALTVLKTIYQNIYTEVRRGLTEEKETTRLGFLTTTATKSTIINNLSTAINEDDILIPDKATLKELKMFDEDHLRQIRYDPNLSHHLDRVMSLAIAYEMRNFVGFGQTVEMTEPVMSDPYATFN